MSNRAKSRHLSATLNPAHSPVTWTSFANCHLGDCHGIFWPGQCCNPWQSNLIPDRGNAWQLSVLPENGLELQVSVNTLRKTYERLGVDLILE